MEHEPLLAYERLDVYRVSIEVLAAAHKITSALPKGHAPLADQFRRAAISVPLNIAEGTARPTDADAARHYGIARGSALECGAILDALKALGLVTPSLALATRSQIVRVVQMLSRMCR